MEARGPLWVLSLPLSFLYGSVSRFLRRGSPQAVEGLKVVSVGNLSVGGSGKTPLVIAIASLLRARGRQVGIATRGYGGDEAMMLRRRLPGVRVFVGADRLGLARQARAEGCGTLVLDDGFQRRHSLARELDILVLDWTRREQDRYCLPSGRLREPLFAASEAQAVVVTHAPEGWNATALRVGLPTPYSPMRFVFRGDHTPIKLKSLQGGASKPLGWLKGKAVTALSGIGNPAVFEEQLADLGATVTSLRFADHHAFKPADLRGLSGSVVCTDKDAVKLEGMSLPAGVECLVLEMELRVSPAREFEAMLSS